MQLTFTLGRGRAMRDKRYAVQVGRFVMLTSLLCIYTWRLCYAQSAPPATPPGLLKGLFENNKVKVTEIHMEPGYKSKMHTHAEPYVVYVFAPAKMRVTFPDGKTTEQEWKAGDVFWDDPVSHVVENIGATEFHALEVDIKASSTKEHPDH